MTRLSASRSRLIQEDCSARSYNYEHKERFRIEERKDRFCNKDVEKSRKDCPAVSRERSSLSADSALKTREKQHLRGDVAVKKQLMRSSPLLNLQRLCVIQSFKIPQLTQ